MTARRFSDWRSRLIQYLAAASRKPFREGQHDCALFLAGAVEAMTGVDYAAPYRGRYTTLRGGMRILRKDGFADHIVLARAHLHEKPISFAAEGDGAYLHAEGSVQLGLVQGAQVYVLRPEGLGLVPLTAATAALEV
jgi:hypothetical protein